MATNFRVKIGKLDPLTFIRHLGILKRIGISQFRVQKVQWQSFIYIVRKFSVGGSSNSGVKEGERRTSPR